MLKTQLKTGASILTFLSLLMGSHIGFAASTIDKAQIENDEYLKSYFTVSDIVYEEIEDQGFGAMGNLDKFYYNRFLQSYNAVSSASTNEEINPEDATDIGAIVRIGKEIWKVIEKNKPVVNASIDFANILPKANPNWMELENWKAPQSRVYHVQYKNLYNMTVVDYSYRVLFTSGGTFNGKGKYLSHVTILPANLNVLWGYRFNSEVKIANIVNQGTTESPVAGAEMQVTWSVNTPLVSSQSSSSYFMNGNGYFNDLSSLVRIRSSIDRDLP